MSDFTTIMVTKYYISLGTGGKLLFYCLHMLNHSEGLNTCAPTAGLMTLFVCLVFGRSDHMLQTRILF